MKIAILTLNLHTNYGGILQTYALQQVLQQMGHDSVTLFPGMRLPSTIRLALRFCKRLLLKILRKNNVYLETEEERLAISRYTSSFMDIHIKKHILRDYSILQEKMFDAYIVGSDQVWRFKYFARNDRNKMLHAFLDFTKGWKVKRIVYAASFGSEKWEYPDDLTKDCVKLIRDFDSVGIREINGVELCKQFLKREDAQFVLDPTMLLDSSHYNALIDRAPQPRQDGNIMCYILDECEYKSAFIKLIQHHLDKKAFNATAFPENKKKPIRERIQPPVEQWLQGFRQCECVITDSFHACVFSILYHRPFYVIGNEERGMDRFSSLLSVFGLEQCLIMKGDDVPFAMPDIDWEDVDTRLYDMRMKSLNFLIRSLKTC